ncbi:MAG: hypothetical protein HKN40_00025 [Winogradskyella sp.]|uniref:hypothetical protein n=1 Tax=Winogradskyella sp. TaxID=1883156 RepID=UPI001846C1C6|nr:hypothetical protein [Winogradskyella sp.]
MIKKFTLLFAYLLILIFAFPEQIMSWIDPEHCFPDKAFRYSVFIFGNYIGVTYLIFAYVVYFRLRKVIKGILDDKFIVALSWVFVFCALEHFTASYTMINQYAKLLFIFVYPPLVYWHTYLLVNAKKNYNKLSNILEDEKNADIVAEVKDLKQEIKEMKSLLSKSYASKHWGDIGDKLREDK